MLHPEKYNALIYHMKKVKDISEDLNEDDLTIISEELKIARAERKIKEVINQT